MDWTTLGKTPIPGDAPAGVDVKYDTDFEKLHDEIDKLSSPTASGQVDWGDIVATAAKILADKSKDLTVASYMAVGLIITRQVDGLDTGVQIIRDLVETHWDNFFPPKKRMRGRMGALAWWLEKSEAELSKLQVKDLPLDQAQRIKDNLAQLNSILGEKMPDAPLLRPIERVVERWPVKKPPESAEPKEESAATAEPKPAAGPGRETPKPAPAKAAAPAEAPENIGSVQDARRAIDGAMQKIRQASFFMLQNDLKDPLAYRYRRIASWAKLQEPPPNTDGATQITPPAPQVIEPLVQLRDEGNWPALIQNAEQQLSQFLFWFDLNRFVAEALQELGTGHQKALAAVCQETAGFLQRLPGVQALTFSDGMPFADLETKKWLQILGAAGPAAGTAPAGPAAAGDTDGMQKTVKEAAALARKKQLVEAVNLLQQEMNRTVSRFRRLRWRLAIADVLLNVKKTPLALPHLDRILEEIDAYRLEEWDPELAMEGLKSAWKGYSTLALNEHKEKSAALLARIARLDPVEAIRLQK
ncbi:MAG: type VI secretion system protein TssA [Desulfosarcinaceae bacterium]